MVQLIFSTLLKGIIRKECQSFTNHGHAKTPPTVFNPLSLWLTLPRDMGVSHTLWPSNITRAILACLWFAQGLHKAQKKSKQQNRSMMFRVILCVQFYRLMQLVFSTLLKVIIRKECRSFTNHGHAKTPPAVFNPLSLWLTLPRDMGVSHTLLPSSITGAILACLWFAQGLHKAQKKSKEQSRSMMFRVVLCVQFYRLVQLVFFHVTKSNKGKSKCGGTLPGRGHKNARCR